MSLDVFVIFREVIQTKTGNLQLGLPKGGGSTPSVFVFLDDFLQIADRKGGEGANSFS